MGLFFPRSPVIRAFFPGLRQVSSWQTSSLKFNEFGDPTKVLQKITETLSSDLAPKHVAVKFLAAPVNPMDINIIQGVYEIKPPVPAVAGSEGVGEIIKVGGDVGNLRVGDRVITTIDTPGTWRTHAIMPESSFLKVPMELPLIQAATMSVNPLSAFRMLHDYTKLREGDVIVQNGANSAVGQAVIQLAKHYKWRTINVIRERPNKAETVQLLADLGATHVITDQELQNRDLTKHLPKAKLALNCVGGTAVSDLTKLMENCSIMVTYGAMSKKPLVVPTLPLIFKEIIFCGFWLKRWNDENPYEKRLQMVNHIIDLMLKKVLKPPTLQPILLADYHVAIEQAQEGFAGKKQLFVMDDNTFAKIKHELSQLAQISAV